MTSENIMIGFLDADDFLTNLRNGDATLTEKIYYLSVDGEKIGSDDLAELKSRCTGLGYSFNSVEMKRYLRGKKSPQFFYLVRTVPVYPAKEFENYVLLNQR